MHGPVSYFQFLLNIQDTKCFYFIKSVLTFLIQQMISLKLAFDQLISKLVLLIKPVIVTVTHISLSKFNVISKKLTQLLSIVLKLITETNEK